MSSARFRPRALTPHPPVRYGLIAEQKKGAYRYFADLGDRMEVAVSRTSYVDEVDHLTQLNAL